MGVGAAAPAVYHGQGDRTSSNRTLPIRMARRNEQKAQAYANGISRSSLRSIRLFARCDDLNFGRLIRRHVDKVVEADDLVMQHIFDVTTCVAHYVVEKM